MSTCTVALTTLSLRYPTGMQGRNFAIHSLGLYARQDTALGERIGLHTLELAHTDSEEEVAGQVLDLAPDLLALSCYVWNTPTLIAVAEQVRRARPETRVVLGGPDVAPRAEALLRRHGFIDAVALGEGEEAFRLLLRRLTGLDGEDWRSTPGWLVRDGAGEPMRNEELPFVEMDRLPSFLDAPDQVESSGGLAIQGARGCRYHCAYCQYNATPRRVRSLPLVLEEIDRFAASGGGTLCILDAGINQDRGRFRAILERIAQHPQIHFEEPEINVEDLDDDDLSALVRVTSTLAIGLQTTHRPTLRNIQRHYRPERFGERIAALRQRQVRFTLDIIYGLPGDSYESFKRTMDDAYALEPQLVLPFRLQVLPGSTLARQAARFGLRYDLEPPYLLESSDSFSAEEMGRARRLAEANDLLHTFTFSSRAFQIAARSLAVRPSEWIESFLAGAWRDEGAVTDEELDRWSAGELEGLLLAFSEWIAASFCERGGEVPDVIQDELSRQILHTLLLFRPYVAGEDVAPLPPGAVCHLSPNVIVAPLRVPSAQGSHLLLHKLENGTVEQRLLSAAAGAVLTLADGTRAVEALLQASLAAAGLADDAGARDALRATLEELAASDVLRWS